MKTQVIVAILLLVVTFESLAQISLPGDERINGKLVWAAFEPQRQILQQSSAVIYLDEKSRLKSLYGVVVSESGYILTKASELEGYEHLSVRVNGELYKDVQFIKQDDNWDVALLKVESDSVFSPVKLSSEDNVEQGQWAISNGSTTRRERRVRVGVISAETREIKAGWSDVILGVSLVEDDEGKVKIVEVSEDSGAERAGLKKGDIIELAAKEKIEELADMLQTLQGKEVGDSIELEVLRGDESLKLEVDLMARPGDGVPMTRNDMMSGGEDSLSKRRDGFPRVIHHDTPLTKSSVGGPLLNLKSECIGMNIARASRVATFAIPAQELSVIIENMISE